MSDHDVDVAIVGSGFGGSVAALRLAEKGYSVVVYEAGRRFGDADFAKTSWDVRNYLFAPALGCFGVQRIHHLPHVTLLAGAGVGGGSLNYANTLYVPSDAFFTDPQWGRLADWRAELAPHYATAQRMLGAVENRCEGTAEEAMRLAAARLGCADTLRRTPVAVFFGEPDVTVADPYFGGEGPPRTGCTECGNCMVGCRVGAKNTLVKNYLWLAEKRGVRIEPLRTVVDVLPRPGRDGFLVSTLPTGRRSDRRTIRAGQVVLAGGAWGTQQLLHRLRRSSLPDLSPMLGRLTRTNSEALGGATLLRRARRADLAHGVAITTSFQVDPDTHVENVRYGPGSNLMGLLATMLVDSDTGRLAGWAKAVGRDPFGWLRTLSVRGWSERSVIALVMQSLDNSITVSGAEDPVRGFHLTSEQGHGHPNPTWFPQASAAVRALADALASLTGQRTAAHGNVTAVVDRPLTAHFLGGCVIGGDVEHGVVDPYHRVWNYPGLHIMDGSTVSANLGVNPSLTITAQAERACSLWPAKGEPDHRPSLR